MASEILRRGLQPTCGLREVDAGEAFFVRERDREHRCASGSAHALNAAVTETEGAGFQCAVTSWRSQN